MAYKSRWKAARFDQISTGIYDGPHATPPRAKSGRVFLRIENINHGHLDLSDIRWIDEADWPRWTRRVTPQADDIVFSYEANLGLFARIPDGFNGCLGRRLALIRPDQSKINPKYLLYATLSPQFQSFLKSRTVHGSTVDRISLKEFPAYEIPLPPLEAQHGIASVLGSLDDKIELNRRMNRTLEEMARALFKSWFVDFDPVHANAAGNPTLPPDLAAIFPVEFEPSSIGDIPQGWEAEELNRVISIFDSKRIPLSKRQRESRPGCYPYHGAAGVMDYVDDFLFDGIYVLMGEDGSVVNNDGSPVLQYVWGKLWVNNHAHVLEGRNISTEHLYLHLRETNIAPFVTGAVQPKLNQGNLKKVPFVLPPSELCRLFANRIDPLFARIRVNAEETAILASLRDALLPRLLSGELSVAAAEEAIA